MNEPGIPQQVGIEGLGPVYFTCLCGACKSEHVAIDTPNRGNALSELYWVQGWMHRQPLGWVCPACDTFLASVRAEKS